MERQIGVISSVKFGFGGYQNAMLGLELYFDFKGSGVGAFVSGGWTIKRPELAKWSEGDRQMDRINLCDKIVELLKEAKIDDVTKLKGIPVECYFVKMELKDWRILSEAIL